MTGFSLNVNFTSIPNYSWTHFFDENKQHGVSAAVTVPMLGWVAKDTSSYSYPVSAFRAAERHHRTEP